MATATRQDIMIELKSLLSTNITIPDPEGEPTVNENTGVVIYPTKTDTKFNIYVQGPTKDLVESLIDAILTKINDNGLSMGDSHATKLDVS